MLRILDLGCRDQLLPHVQNAILLCPQDAQSALRDTLQPLLDLGRFGHRCASCPELPLRCPEPPLWLLRLVACATTTRLPRLVALGADGSITSFSHNIVGAMGATSGQEGVDISQRHLIWVLPLRNSMLMVIIRAATSPRAICALPTKGQVDGRLAAAVHRR